jgi:hypothetical protein
MAADEDPRKIAAQRMRLAEKAEARGERETDPERAAECRKRAETLRAGARWAVRHIVQGRTPH